MTSVLLENIFLKVATSKVSHNLNRNVRRHIAMQRPCQEVQIPVPWGYIAGKWWGPEDKRPIVAFHGWQDNCGTFDKLIPYLPQHIPVLALDFAGHGHSSQLPPGIPYFNINSAIIIKRLVQYFGWKKLSLMGHSMGAITSFIYTFMFPDEIDFLICIDGLHPLIHPKKYDRVAKSIEHFIRYDDLNSSGKEPPSYTYAEMEQKTSEGSQVGSYRSIDLESAKHLLARNIEPSKLNPGKYYFKRDPRIKIGPLEVNDPVEVINYSSRITCPIFLSKAAGSPFFGSESIFREVNERLKKNSKDCQFHEIPGTHHVHLNQPKLLEAQINSFIKKHDTEDRSYGGIKEEIKVLDDIYEVTLEKINKAKL